MVSTATEAVLLDRDAFARMVTEEGLKILVMGPYQYAGKRGKHGWELYRASLVDWDKLNPIEAATANPAAGANPAAITVPAGVKWQLWAATAELVADATVITRNGYILIDNGTTNYYSTTWGINITAGLTTRQSFTRESQVVTAGTQYGANIAPIELLPGWRIRWIWNNIQAADDSTAVSYLYKEAPL